MNARSGPLIVTGAAGFIGARLAARLIVMGERVIAVDDLRHFETRPEVAAIYRQATPHGKEDRERLPEFLERAAPGEVAGIIHMGACTDTTQYDTDYLERVNTAYTRHLWTQSARLGVPFLYASSAAVYGDGTKGYSDETPPDVFTPLNPYGESKHRFDIWALGEGQAAPPPSWSGFRFFNVYGFGEAHKKKMSSVLYQAFVQILDRGQVRLFRSHKRGVADGHQSRDFIFVDDVVDVLCHAWQKGLPDGIYNLGTGKSRTFLDLAHAVFAAMGREPQVEFIDTPPEIRARYQYFTEARMRKLHEGGYTATFTSLEKGALRYWQRLREVLTVSG